MRARAHVMLPPSWAYDMHSMYVPRMPVHGAIMFTANLRGESHPHPQAYGVSLCVQESRQPLRPPPPSTRSTTMLLARGPDPGPRSSSYPICLLLAGLLSPRAAPPKPS